MAFLESHEKDYVDQAWKDYTIQELGSFVHLLVKRAGMRDSPDKRRKDLYDARNYLLMIESHLSDAETTV